MRFSFNFHHPVFISVAIAFFWLGADDIKSQSFEVLLGHERIFIDTQYLTFFDEDKKWLLFSRARATAEYDEAGTDLFTAGYLNYELVKGFGISMVGRVSSFDSGLDVGPHFFRNTKTWSLFLLPTVNLGNELLFSWFSIIKFMPRLNETLKLYSSYEQFSAFNSGGHISSVQRIRLGLEKKGYQFGIGLNLRQSGRKFSDFDSNVGGFIRKQF